MNFHQVGHLFAGGLCDFIVFGEVVVHVPEINQRFFNKKRAVLPNEFSDQFALMEERFSNELQVPAGIHQ